MGRVVSPTPTPLSSGRVVPALVASYDMHGRAVGLFYTQPTGQRKTWRTVNAHFFFFFFIVMMVIIMMIVIMITRIQMIKIIMTFKEVILDFLHICLLHCKLLF